MHKFSLLIAFFLFLVSSMVYSQNLSEYRWKNRLILLISDTPNSPKVKSQISLFVNETEQIDERKILILQAFPKYYLIGYDNQVRRDSEEIYFEFSRPNQSFELLLFGLDGQIKFRSNELVTPQKIYAIIDSMPMRQ